MNSFIMLNYDQCSFATASKVNNSKSSLRSHFSFDEEFIMTVRLLGNALIKQMNHKERSNEMKKKKRINSVRDVH